MPTITRDYQIATLGANTTFYDWFIKENEEIIAKLNLMNAFSVTGGDGIYAPTNSSGLVTLSIGGTAGSINAGLTFNGDAIFNGFVSIPNISYKITGITTGSSGGFSFGSPLRYVNTTSGYTLAKADTQERAESLGLVSRITDTGTYITILGRIDGDFTSVNGGSTLSPGCFYFLSPSVTGGISTTEPTNSGQTSKPVLFALGASAGIVLQYRGNYLNNTASGAGVTGGNRIYFSLPDSLSGLSSEFTVGKVISYNPSLDGSDTDTIDYFTNNGNRTLFDGWFLSRSTNNFQTPFGGREEDFVVGMITSISTAVAGYYSYEVAVAGNVEYNLGAPGVYYISNDFDTTVASSPQLTTSSSLGYSGKLFAIQYDNTNLVVINNPRKGIFGGSGVASLASSSSSGTLSTENLLPNGDFSIWQRSSIGKNSGYTGTGNIIFADMWRRHDGISGSDATKSYSIQRQSFADIQSDVEGDPQYYLDIKTLGLSGATNDELLVGHVVPDAKSFNGETVTLSFYGKCTYSNYELQPYYARYNGTSRIDYNTVGNPIELTTSWQRFDVTFDILTLPNPGSPLNDDYLEIGFNFFPLIDLANDNAVPLGQNLVVSLASVCLFGGSATTFPHIHKNINERLNLCRQLYYSSYNLDEIVGTESMLNKVDASISTRNQVVLPLNYCNNLDWPVQMRETPSVSFYSPKTGYQGDGYNQTASRDLRNCSGTIGYNTQKRIAKLGSPTISADASTTGARICILGGAVPYDAIHYHIIADADYPI